MGKARPAVKPRQAHGSRLRHRILMDLQSLEYVISYRNSRLRPKSAIYLRMVNKAPDDPILKRFRAAVTELYGDRVERVVLYGSRARGHAHPDSEYDGAA